MSTTTYIRLEIVIPDHLQEIFISGFEGLEFAGFEQQEDRLIAYIDQQQMNDSGREELENWLMAQRDECYIESESVEEERNWNEEWEQSIQPQRIGRFVITPTWGNPEITAEDVVLEIDPKMAFGTGYHETTRLILRMLPEVVQPGDTILDAGTGTGVLAIAALKIGAAHALGFDIDEWSHDNATENALLNLVSDRFVIKQGGFEQLDPGRQYDITIANINRNALIENAVVLASTVTPGGALLLSGLLRQDEEQMLKQSAYSGWKHVSSIYENEWVAIWLQRP